MDKISVNSTDLSAWRAGKHNLPYKIYGAKEPKIQGKGSNNKKGTIVDFPEKKIHALDLLNRNCKPKCSFCGSNLVVNGNPISGYSDKISFFWCVRCSHYWFTAKINLKSDVGKYRVSVKQEMLNSRKKIEAEVTEKMKNYLNQIDYAMDIGFVQYLDRNPHDQTQIYNCGGPSVELTLPKARVRHDTQLRLNMISEYGLELIESAGFWCISRGVIE